MAAPTPLSTRAAPRRARLGLVLAVAVLAVLAACSTIGSLTGLITDLQDEGFTDVGANVDQGDTSVLVVSADRPEDTTIEEAQDQAAEIVWTQFPRRFEGLRLTIDGERRTWTYAELEDELGARPAGLDSEGDLGDDVNRIAVYAIVGVAIAAVLGAGLVGLIIVLVVRANRRKAAALPRPHPEPWMPPGVPGPGAPPSGATSPVPPTGGWTSAGTTSGSPPASGPSLAKAPLEPSGPSTPPAGPPPPPSGRRPRDPDARHLGRRPRRPAPDPDHTPPGWG